MTDSKGRAGSVELLNAWESLLQTIGRPEQSATTDSVRPHIPVTVLAGFLGAGKTTLLTDLIARSDGLRILAIVNDIGAVNVDAELIRRQGTRTLELTNGCSCCILSSNLRDMLIEICNAGDRPEHIILEASGLADPMGIAQTIAATDGVTLDGIVTLVDATTLERHWHSPGVAHLFQRQIESAHLLVLTKATDKDDLMLRDRLGERAPGRPVLLPNRDEASVAVITDAALRGARPDPGVARHHLIGFQSETIVFDHPVHLARLERKIIDAPDSLFRLKGLIVDESTRRETEVQCVGRRWHIRPVSVTSDRRLSEQLVAIGRSRDERFEAFIVDLRSLAKTKEPVA